MTHVLLEFVRWMADGPGWLPMLVNAVVKATVLLAGAGLLSFALRRASAAMRHFVWSMGLAGSLALPVLMFALPSWPVPILPAPPIAAARAQPTLTPAETTPPEQTPGTASEPNPGTPSQAARERQTPRTEDSGPALAQLARLVLPGTMTLLTLWAAVALLLVARLAAGHVRVRRLARKTTGAPPWEALAQSLGERAGLAQAPRFVEGHPSAMPMTWGSSAPSSCCRRSPESGRSHACAPCCCTSWRM